MKPICLLVINPNSSASVTHALAAHFEPLTPALTNLTYFTGPTGAPPSIDDTPTSLQSTAACLPALEPLLGKHDGFLVACYSAHPLVPELRRRTRKPVIGIFDSSVTHSLLLADRFGIVTTGPGWEPLLTLAVRDFLGGQSERFVGVMTTGLGVLELHAAPREEVNKRMGEAAKELVRRGAGAIALGCAGMVGLGEAIGEAVGREVRVVDVTSGLWELVGLVRCQQA
ncbi:hypothetical protein CALCODRAFT_429848 [Calocera cornea HHB12733]|uniref:Asp/Glu/hydantoin racemase n=1 Tax=Calocera cornea HHB12733 TaxID=1353952 RepID=A0A165I7U8_9BASI|nr:hypothetical protein CALCODRAFT_429848 [Calocera cornea HHB12733]